MIEEPERQKAILHVVMSAIVSIAVLLGGIIGTAWPLKLLVEGNPGEFGPGLSRKWVEAVYHYWTNGLVRWPRQWLEYLAGSLFSADAPPHWTVMLWCAVALLCFGLLSLQNKHRFEPVSHGKARFADKRDIRRAGLFSETGLILGRSEQGRLIRLPNPFSCLLIAPPGSGKSAGIIIPNLVADWPEWRRVLGSRRLGWLFNRPVKWENGDIARRPSFVVNDPKGELLAKCAAHLRNSGYQVIEMSLGSMSGNRWNPVGPESLAGGRELTERRNNIIAQLGLLYLQPIDVLTELLVQARDYTDWQKRLAGDPTLSGKFILTAQAAFLEQEALSKRRSHVRDTLRKIIPDINWLLEIQSKRESEIRRLAVLSIDERIEPHWRDKGRAALQGLQLFTVARCEHDTSYGEASFGRMIDFITDATRKDKEATEEELAEAARKAAAQQEEDAIKDMLDDFIKESRKNGYPARIVTELSQLARTPSRERGSVISTMEGGIDIFKQATVRRNTSGSDFSINDLRWNAQPVAVFITTPLEDAASLGKIVGMFFESCATRFISQADKEIKKRGRPIAFEADEFWTLPNGMESLMQIPALGRGQHVILTLVGQSYGQIALKINKEAVAILKGATASQVLLQQNDQETAESVSKIIGNRTHITSNESRTEGIGKGVNPWQKNVSRSATGLPLVSHQDLMNLKPLEEQLVLFQGWMSTPIRSSSPAWFKDRTLRARVMGKKSLRQKLSEWFKPKKIDESAELDFDRASNTAIIEAFAAEEASNGTKIIEACATEEARIASINKVLREVSAELGLQVSEQ